MFSLLTIPANAEFNVKVKFQALGFTRPNFAPVNPNRAPPEPAITVLTITLEVIIPASWDVIVPKDPPLNARNPVIKIMPPIAINFSF